MKTNPSIALGKSCLFGILLLLIPCVGLAQPRIEPSGSGPTPNNGTPAADAPQVAASCIGRKDGLLSDEQASYLAAAICQAISNNGLPTAQVSQQTGGPTSIDLLLSMDASGEVLVTWSVRESGAVLGSDSDSYGTYNAAVADVNGIGKRIARSKRGQDFSEGFDEDYYWTSFAFSFVYAAGAETWGIGLSTAARASIWRIVLAASARFNFNPDGSLFNTDGALEIGANILGFDDHALYSTIGVAAFGLFSGANSIFDDSTDVVNRTGVGVSLVAGLALMRSNPVTFFVELRTVLPFYQAELDLNDNYVAPIYIEAGIGF